MKQSATIMLVLLAVLVQCTLASTRKYLRQKADPTAHTLTFATTPSYLWSGGLCSRHDECHAKIRSRVPSAGEEIGTSLCGCYATSIIDPLDECQGELEGGCAMAVCYVNSCYGVEAFCSSRGVCELKTPEIVPRLEVGSWGDAVSVDEAASEGEEDVLVVKHQDQVVVFTPESNNEESPKESNGDESAENGVLVVKHEGKVVVFTPESDEVSEQDAITTIDGLSMSMNLEQNAFEFEWIDSMFDRVDSVFESLMAHVEAETTTTTTSSTTTSTTTVATAPLEETDDADTDFSWVELKEDENDVDDADFELSLSMSMIDEISIDYTWA